VQTDVKVWRDGLKPVKRFRIEVGLSADELSSVQLYIENRPIAETIDDHFIRSTKKPWPEKNRCVVSASALLASLDEDGSYAILICTACARAGYQSCEDIGVRSINVDTTDRTITWTIDWPDWIEEDLKPLRLEFDGAEYQREFEKLI